jgi:uncharacterized protein
MQEIVASISRIIAQDSGTPYPVRTSARDKVGILELTDAIEADGSVRKLDVKNASSVLGPTGLRPPSAAAATAPPSPRDEPGLGETADKLHETLVSSTAAEAAVTAFGRLATVAAEQRAELGPGLGAGARTLEDIVRDALRPLLQAWLDDHLPGIVERLVEVEIHRLAREARLR